MSHFTDAILSTPADVLPQPVRTGLSSEGRPIPAYRFGAGPCRLSLIAGCHADEPTGSRLLRKLVASLDGLPDDDSLLRDFSWWIVPHANPDGEAVNRAWYDETDDGPYDLARYLRHVDRAYPAEDIEFGFPIPGVADAKRPENAFLNDFWRSAGGPFHLHASLHSMAAGFGAWFLIDPHWAERSEPLQARCRQAAHALDYPLHDLDRQGEKGFTRIAPGFATRPNFRAMRQYFLDREDEKTAGYFHPSSMESIRALGGDCLTLVSEIPFFILPGEPAGRSWPHPEYEAWLRRMETWKAELLLEKRTDASVNEEAHRLGLKPVPVRDQMKLQWVFVNGGVDLVA